MHTSEPIKFYISLENTKVIFRNQFEFSMESVYEVTVRLIALFAVRIVAVCGWLHCALCLKSPKFLAILKTLGNIAIYYNVEGGPTNANCGMVSTI